MYTIKNVDCNEGMPQLSDRSINLIVTSPPYNIGLKYDTYVDKKGDEEFYLWMDTIAVHFSRLLNDDGHLFLNVGFTPTKPWVAMDVAQVFRKHFVLQNNFIWLKSVVIDGKQKGHYRPLSNSKRFVNVVWENIFHFTHTGNASCDREAIGVEYSSERNVNRWKSTSDKHCAGNVWYIPYTTYHPYKKRQEHPAMFPVELVDKCIRFSQTKKGDVMMDPFMGSGSCGVSAMRHGLNFVGFELSEKYFKMAQQNIKEASVSLFPFMSSD